MTATNQSVAIRPPAPRFSAWSPLIAGLADLIASSFPGWIVALMWAAGVVSALPFRQFRMVVPLAILALAAGWLVATLLSFSVAQAVGAFVVK
jgi:type III secretory pathway component EscS